MKIRHPLLLRWTAYVLATIIRAWHATVRPLKVVVDGSQHPIDPARHRYVYGIWHDSILSLMYLRTKVNVLISHHIDGELVTQVCRYLHIGVVRGSSTRGGAAGLMKMVDEARDRHLLVTPDGPRGPRHVIRPGLVYLASMTGLPIVLLAVGYSRAVRLKTWDRMAIPLPWSTTYGIVSEPIHVPPGLTPDEMAGFCGRIERRFVQLLESAERWAETGVRPEPAELQPVEEPHTLPHCA